MTYAMRYTSARSERMIRLTVLVAVRSYCRARRRCGCAHEHVFTLDVVAALVVLGVSSRSPRRTSMSLRERVSASAASVMVLVASHRRVPRLRVLPRPGHRRMLWGASTVAQLRERAWQKIAFNASADALSLLAATAVFWSDREPTSRWIDVRLCARDRRLARRRTCSCNAALRSIPVALSCGEPYFKVLRRDRSPSTSGRFRLRCWGWGSGGCTWSSVRRSSRCSSSRS